MIVRDGSSQIKLYCGLGLIRLPTTPFLLRARGNHRAHAARRACAGQIGLEDLVDFWILVFVFDLTTVLFDVYLELRQAGADLNGR
jgi:hypothetical protein